MARPWWEMEPGEKVGVGSRETGRPGRARVGGGVGAQGRATARGAWTPGQRPWWEEAGGGQGWQPGYGDWGWQPRVEEEPARASMRGGGVVPSMGWAPYLPLVTRGMQGGGQGWQPEPYAEYEKAGRELGGPPVGLGEMGAALERARREGPANRLEEWAAEIVRPSAERLGEAWRAPFERVGAEAGEELIRPSEVFEMRREQALAEGATEEEAYRQAGLAQLEAMQRGMTAADYKRAFGEWEDCPLSLCPFSCSFATNNQ